MSAADVDTSLEVFTALTESLDQSPPCDIGRAGDPPPGFVPCPNPAAFSARVHQCGTENGVLLLLCNHCLISIVTQLAGHLSAAGGPFQEQCGFVITCVEDFIWDVAPLR